MGNVTAIKRFTNHTPGLADILNVEHAQRMTCSPGQTLDFDIWIPWCTSQVDFDHNHYLSIRLTNPAITYYIWQSNDDGSDVVRFSTEARWMAGASVVDGAAWVGNDRTVDILANGSLRFSVL